MTVRNLPQAETEGPSMNGKTNQSKQTRRFHALIAATTRRAPSRAILEDLREAKMTTQKIPK
jgi:NAD(P)H-flavin reductase